MMFIHEFGDCRHRILETSIEYLCRSHTWRWTLGVGRFDQPADASRAWSFGRGRRKGAPVLGEPCNMMQYEEFLPSQMNGEKIMNQESAVMVVMGFMLFFLLNNRWSLRGGKTSTHTSHAGFRGFRAVPRPHVCSENGLGLVD